MSSETPPIRALVVDGVGHAELVVRSIARATQLCCEVDRVERMEDAVAALEAKRYDVVLIDPGAEGSVAIQRLGKAAGLAAIVALSARDDDALRREVVAAGADDFLVKGWVVGSSIGSRVLERSLSFAIERRRQRAEIERLNESFRRLAQIDPLTGLPNRRGLELALTSACSRAARTGEAVAAVLVDCDNFKSVNEQHGHAAGDVVLSEIAQRLDRSVRPSDTVARVGGDEFIILLPGATVQDGLEVAERSRVAVSDLPIGLGNEVALSTSASFGVSAVDLQAPSIESLLKSARAALAASKRAGKNRVQAASPPTDASADPGLEFLDRVVAGAVPLGVVSLPIVRLSDGAVVAHELHAQPPAVSGTSAAALARAAAKHDRVVLLDQVCFETYLTATRSFHHAATIHLNLHPHTLLEPGLVAYIAAKVEGLRPRREVCLEFDAALLSAVLHHLDSAIRRLKQARIRLAIDDLRVGAGTLDDLLQFGPDMVKLAPACVVGCGSDSATRRSLETLARIAASAGAELVAVGIETVEDLDVCRALGIVHGQGPLLGRPLELVGLMPSPERPDDPFRELPAHSLGGLSAPAPIHPELHAR